MNAIDKLYSVKEAKALIGAQHTKFYALVAAGKIAIVKNGGRSFVRESEIKRFLDNLPAGETPKMRMNKAANTAPQNAAA